MNTIYRAVETSRIAAAVLMAFTVVCMHAAVAQEPFAQPESAADALIAALRSNEETALQRVLGDDWRKLLAPADVDPADRAAVIAKAEQARRIDQQGDTAAIHLGNDGWLLPIPLKRESDGRWRFDTQASYQQLLSKRIGANELAAMQAALAYLDAQREYAMVDRDGNGVLEYARKLRSTAGKRDGLIWDPALGDISPLGERYLPTDPNYGYHGYRFRILERQGSHAVGGARSYLLGKHLTSGFALLAWPVEYGVTGVMSFIVNQHGTLYQRDFGPDTLKLVSDVKSFDPEPGWEPVKNAAP